VRPVVDCDLDLVADLEDGRRLVGQHRITGRTEPALESRVARVFLSRPGADSEARTVRGSTRSPEDLIAQADLICFPVGSFYTSLIATLLPEGVADAVARSGAPKVYVPNPDGTDSEEFGLDLAAKVRRLLACLEDGASARSPPRIYCTTCCSTRPRAVSHVRFSTGFGARAWRSWTYPW
jgi:2-phospho-L-lactate transferase/gluconeogenesis factor (CofD/UPF0052 family)